MEDLINRIPYLLVSISTLLPRFDRDDQVCYFYVKAINQLKLCIESVLSFKMYFKQSILIKKFFGLSNIIPRSKETINISFRFCKRKKNHIFCCDKKGNLMLMKMGLVFSNNLFLSLHILPCSSRSLLYLSLH